MYASGSSGHRESMADAHALRTITGLKQGPRYSASQNVYSGGRPEIPYLQN
jgi:hypothetical protein